MDKISSFPELDSIALLNCVRVPVNEHNKAKSIDEWMPCRELERIIMDNPVPREHYINLSSLRKLNELKQERRETWRCS